MKKQRRSNLIDIEIDKLTNSITNALTSEVFDTAVTQLKLAGIKQVRKKEWVFDWRKEIKYEGREVYKLTTVENPGVIHGLICLEDKEDHVFMHLIEAAKFNKGNDKMYLGVPGNLVAFACKLSFDMGYEGYLAFEAKSSLIKHYEASLGATHFKDISMFIGSNAAIRLIRQYFKS